MINLYRAIGIRDSRADKNTLIRAIRAMPDNVNSRAASYILLHPERRAVYDRHHDVLITIGRVRGAIGLTSCPNWVVNAGRVFEPVESQRESQQSQSMAGAHSSGIADRDSERSRPARANAAVDSPMSGFGVLTAIAVGLGIVVLLVSIFPVGVVVGVYAIGNLLVRGLIKLSK